MEHELCQLTTARTMMERLRSQLIVVKASGLGFRDKHFVFRDDLIAICTRRECTIVTCAPDATFDLECHRRGKGLAWRHHAADLSKIYWMVGQ